MKNLQDQVAIITGSGRGIGAETALAFAKRGAHIVVNDVKKENAEEIAEKIKKLGQKALVSTHDVSSHSEARALVAEAKKTFRRVDILINNAGILRDALLLKLSEENWDDVIRVNLKGPFNMGQACAEVMKDQKRGNIVNLASIAYLGNVGQTNYSAAKAGVVAMTNTWALELSKYGIRVNAIAPGFIETAMTEKVPQDIKEVFIQKIPLKRMGQPHEIADLLCFLVSDSSAYITGQCIHIDGGLTTGIS